MLSVDRQNCETQFWIKMKDVADDYDSSGNKDETCCTVNLTFGTREHNASHMLQEM